MFSSNNSSTFSELLSSLDFIIRDNNQNQGSLKDFKSLSIGIDISSTGYPFLILYPVYEKILRMYTGGFADVVRRVQCQIRCIKPTQDASFGQSNGLANNLKIFFNKRLNNKNWKIKSKLTQEYITTNIKISDITFEAFVKVPEGVLSQSSLIFDFYSQIKIDTIAPVSSQSLSTTSLKELTKIIYEILSNYKVSILNNVKTFKYGSIEPISYFPAVSVIPGSCDVSNRFAGSDSYNSEYFVHSIVELFNFPSNLYLSLDIIHKIRNILIANKYFSNKAFDYSVSDINYGPILIDDKNYFSSQLSVNASSFDPI